MTVAELIEKLASAKKWDVGVPIYRTNNLPLDSTSVFDTYAEAAAYATGSSSTAYAGQLVAVVSDGATDIYKLVASADGALSLVMVNDDEIVINPTTSSDSVNLTSIGIGDDVYTIRSDLSTSITSLQSGKEDKLNDIQKAAVNSGITASYVTKITDNEKAIATKQDILVSGTNIKTINNNSIVGEGNLDISFDTSNFATYTYLSANYLTTTDIAKEYAALDGASFIGAVAGIDPTENAHFATKLYVDTEVGKKQNTLTSAQLKAVDSGVTSTVVAQVNANTETLATKQNTLVSGSNIKTINGNSLVGEGNVEITFDTSDFVTLSTDQTISAGKIFSGEVTVPSPTLDSHAATKSYVDTAINKKQDILTTDQSSAVNSGVTSMVVAQVTTNKNDISSLKTTVDGKDSVSYTSSVTSGTAIGTLNISGSNNVIYSPEVDLTPYAKLVGATFTGAVTLNADPTEDLQAATKAYVDSGISDASISLTSSITAETTRATGAEETLQGNIDTINSSLEEPTLSVTITLEQYLKFLLGGESFIAQYTTDADLTSAPKNILVSIYSDSSYIALLRGSQVHDGYFYSCIGFQDSVGVIMTVDLDISDSTIKFYNIGSQYIQTTAGILPEFSTLSSQQVNLGTPVTGVIESFNYITDSSSTLTLNGATTINATPVFNAGFTGSAGAYSFGSSSTISLLGAVTLPKITGDLNVTGTITAGTITLSETTNVKTINGYSIIGSGDITIKEGNLITANPATTTSTIKTIDIEGVGYAIEDSNIYELALTDEQIASLDSNTLTITGLTISSNITALRITNATFGTVCLATKRLALANDSATVYLFETSNNFIGSEYHHIFSYDTATSTLSVERSSRLIFRDISVDSTQTYATKIFTGIDESYLFHQISANPSDTSGGELSSLTIDDSSYEVVDKDARSRLDSLESDITTAHSTIESNIASEISNRQSADTALQKQIDAIESRQNFSNTFATKAEMTVSTIDIAVNDCVLVLKDESNDDQATVYRRTEIVTDSGTVTEWTYVGPLGDYYTKAQIDADYVKMLSGTTTNGVITNITKSGNEITVTSKSLLTSDPTSSGTTSFAISSISQAADGKITATKASIQIEESQVTGLADSLSGKQDTLVSGTNVKTINGESLLGSTNIAIPVVSATPATISSTITDISIGGVGYDIQDDGARTLIQELDDEKDSVSFTQSLTEGTAVGTLTISGTPTMLYAPTNTDTNYYPTTFSWTDGTTKGPTGTLSGEGMPAVSIGAIPAASTTVSGIITTGAQEFSGVKTFSNGVVFVGTAAAAGLKTRGICGISETGLSKTSLYLNFDSNETYTRKVYLGGEQYGAIALRADWIIGSGAITASINESTGKVTLTAPAAISTITENSTDPVTSGAVYTALAEKQVTLDETQLSAVNSGITSDKVAAYDAYATSKQDALVSGTNIKTVNGETLLGNGDIAIESETSQTINITEANYDSLLKGETVGVSDTLDTSVDVVNVVVTSGGPGIVCRKGIIAGSSMAYIWSGHINNNFIFILVSANDDDGSTMISAYLQPDIEANPSDDATTELTKLTVGDVTYSIPTGETSQTLSITLDEYASLSVGNSVSKSDILDTSIDTVRLAVTDMNIYIICRKYLSDTDESTSIYFTMGSTDKGIALLLITPGTDFTVISSIISSIVTANPTDDTTEELTKLQVGTTVYSIVDTTARADAASAQSSIASVRDSISSAEMNAQDAKNTAEAAYSDVSDLKNSKQDELVSGTNIKTINNESILGEGNIDISGSSTSQTVTLTAAQYSTLTTTGTLAITGTYDITTDILILDVTDGDTLILHRTAYTDTTATYTMDKSLSVTDQEFVTVGVTSTVLMATYVELPKVVATGIDGALNTITVGESTYSVPSTKTETLTLSASSWSSNSITVTSSIATADNILLISPAPASVSAYEAAGAYASAQAAGSITFTCTTTPTDDLTINVVAM